MLALRLTRPPMGARLSLRQLPRQSLAARSRLTQILTPRDSRAYAQQPTSKPSRVEDELRRLAREAANNPKDASTLGSLSLSSPSMPPLTDRVVDAELPEKLLIFHAGTTRTTFIALLKVTTLLVAAFFCGIVAPTYVRSDKPLSDTTRVVLCGLAPPLFVAFVTKPFVTHVHVHLPAQARASRTHLDRFVTGGGLSPSTNVSLTTMSLIATPRVTTMPAGHLVPASRRLGVVNYVRSDGQATAPAARPWYASRPVVEFYIQEGRPGQRRRARYDKRRPDMVEWSIWEALKEKLAKRAVEQ